MTDITSAVQYLYAAFAKGDMPGVLGAFAPDIEWTEATGFPYGGTFIGADAIVENVFMKLGTEWDNWAAVPEQFVTEGDTVVTLGEYSGTCKATGKSFRAPYVHVWKFRDGRVVKFNQHTDTAIVCDAMS